MAESLSKYHPYEQLPTVHHIVQLMELPDLLALEAGHAVVGMAELGGMAATVTLRWRPGETMVHISNSFVEQKLLMEEKDPDLVWLKHWGSLTEGFLKMEGKFRPLWVVDQKPFEQLYMKQERRSRRPGVEAPTRFYDYPIRVLADIDLEATQQWMRKALTLDEAVASYMRLKEIMDSAAPYIAEASARENSRSKIANLLESVTKREDPQEKY